MYVEVDEEDIERATPKALDGLSTLIVSLIGPSYSLVHWSERRTFRMVKVPPTFGLTNGPSDLMFILYETRYRPK